MRTRSSLRTASNPSIRTSSSSRSTSLRRRGPPGLTFVESWSWGRGPCGGLGLMVKREEADPARRMPGRGAGTAGFMGSGFGVGSCSRWGGLAGWGGAFAAGFRGAVAGLTTGLRPLGGCRLAALDEGPRTARFAVGARGGRPRGRDGFFDGPLEELTPEFSDSPDWAWRGPQRYDRRLRRHLRHALWRCVGNALGVNS